MNFNIDFDRVSKSSDRSFRNKKISSKSSIRSDNHSDFINKSKDSQLKVSKVR